MLQNTNVLQLKIRFRVFQSLCIKKVHDMLYYFCQTICVFCLVMICFDGYLLYYMYAGPGTRFSLSLSNGKGVTRQWQYGNKCSAAI